MSSSHIAPPSHSTQLPRLSLGDDDFAILGVPRRYAQDRAVLDAQWRLLQAQVHPDRHVGEGAAAQRLATQWSVRLNEAHQRLRHPVRRAAYLCELGGAPIQAESHTAMPEAFLQQQWAWREALEEARCASEVHALHQEVRGVEGELLQRLEQELDVQQDAAAAAQTVRCLLFLDRFTQDIDRRLDDLSPGG